MSFSALPDPLTASIPFSTLFSSQLNIPQESDVSLVPIAAKAEFRKPRVSVIAVLRYPPSLNASPSNLYFFLRSKNAPKPLVISIRALPESITESIPRSVALGLNVFPNIAPNNPPGLAGSPPA